MLSIAYNYWFDFVLNIRFAYLIYQIKKKNDR